jgi:glycosyltransferase involved in cell wall biosynthesis
MNYKKNLKILIQSFDYPPNFVGGIGVYTYELANNLAELGHKVTILTSFIRGVKKKSKNINYIFVNANNIPSFTIKSLNKLQGKEYDIFASNGVYCYLILKKHLDNFNKVVLFAHNSYIQRFYKYNLLRKFYYPPLILLESFICKKADKIITVSGESYKWLNKYKLDSRKITKIISGVNIKRFYRKSVNKSLFNKYNLNKNSELLLYVGRVEKNKNPIPFIKALPEL